MDSNQDKVNKGFSAIYDEYEKLNLELNKTVWQRQRVYSHVDTYILPKSTILELNAGSGIDAVFFAKKGHSILATDLSEGSQKTITDKIIYHSLKDKLSFWPISFEEIDSLKPKKFDYIFSNFGGLNCIENPWDVLNISASLLNQGGLLTVVIMPKHYPREWLMVLTNRKKAVRRYKKGFIEANVEGETIKVWYHSLSKLKTELANNFEFLEAKSLGVFLPQNDQFGVKRPKLFKLLMKLNEILMVMLPKGMGDYYVATFQKN